MNDPRFQDPTLPPRRRTRGRLLIAMFIALAIALGVMFGGLPLGGVESFSNRQARKLLKDAQNWENESLYRTAAEQYEKVSGNTRLKDEIRLIAARRLAVLQRDHLHNVPAAEAALEKAYHFAKGNDREQLRKDLETLLGAPLGQDLQPTTHSTTSAPTPMYSPDAATSTSVVATPLPDEVAHVGNQSVTIDDIIFAWSRINGAKPPTAADLQTFVPQYLDLVLLADEAEVRAIDRRGRAAHDLKFNRLMTLNTALSQQFIEQFPTPAPEVLQSFYTSHPQVFIPPAVLTLIPLLARDPADAQRIAKLLRANSDFAKLAARESAPLVGLKPGASLKLNSADPSIRPLADDGGLPARLAHLAAGETTGPLQTASGPAFFKLTAKEGGTAPPFDSVREQVLAAYHQQQVALARQSLLNTLRRTRKIDINAQGWEKLNGGAQQAADGN